MGLSEVVWWQCLFLCTFSECLELRRDLIFVRALRRICFGLPFFLVLEAYASILVVKKLVKVYTEPISFTAPLHHQDNTRHNNNPRLIQPLLVERFIGGLPSFGILDGLDFAQLANTIIVILEYRLAS